MDTQTTMQTTMQIRITDAAALAALGDQYAPKDHVKQIDGHYVWDVSADAEQYGVQTLEEVIEDFEEQVGVDPTDPHALSAWILENVARDQETHQDSPDVMAMLSLLGFTTDELVPMAGDSDDEDDDDLAAELAAEFEDFAENDD